MTKRKQKINSANAKHQYCEIEPKECDGNCCYAKKGNKKGG
jgi:hypothetical protein